MAKRKYANTRSVGKVPTLEEFRDMCELYNAGKSFCGIIKSFDIKRDSDFYNWWNNYNGEDEEGDFILRYTKLGKLLRGVDDV
jgi:hypothetical protein